MNIKPFFFYLVFTSLFVPLTHAQPKEMLTVHFDFDKYDLSTDARLKLKEFVDLIKNRAVSSILINGHTDSKGSNGYNDALSLRRAKTVQHWFEQNANLPTANFIAKGFGETALLDQDESDNARGQNRRVEIVILLETPDSSLKESSATAIAKSQRSLTSMLQDSSVKVGSKVTLPNFWFENNSPVLLPKSVATLVELKKVLLENPSMEILIEGHICCVPQLEGISYTQRPSYDISVARAKMVFDYLEANGVTGRMTYQGFGSSMPIYPIPEKTEAEMEANRRVEIRIIKR